MPIMASTLYRDMLNFTRNQFTGIVLLALLAALISVVIGHALSPSTDQLVILSAGGPDMADSASLSLQELVQQMTPEQQKVLLKASAAGTFAGLVGNVILAGALLTMIRLVSDRQPVSVLRAIGLSAPILPRLLLLIFITTLLVQLGLLLIVIPGILIAIAFSMAPVIAASDNLGVFKSMRLSSKLAFANLRLVAPAVLLWLLAKAAVLLLAAQFTQVSSVVAAVLLNGLSNIISALLLIYLYRLYMLLRQA
ncbi:YciC family protein [Acerihabitans sp.]|uniref:YciC family protein n=1 Tax=Acerihabitans sp. TaxID=2811394 RepID=UPI002D90660E|nr:YciC family protein [Rhizomicrobium sp.]